MKKRIYNKWKKRYSSFIRNMAIPINLGNNTDEYLKTSLANSKSIKDFIRSCPKNVSCKIKNSERQCTTDLKKLLYDDRFILSDLSVDEAKRNFAKDFKISNA